MQMITLHSEETWPASLKSYLERNLQLFASWEFRDTKHAFQKVQTWEYDSAIYGLRDVLNNHALHGYHCTRLTDVEIDGILSEGMSLQNKDTLSARINQLLLEGKISEHIGHRLKNENQANEEYRSHMLWFCFFEPQLAGESGIKRFFRSWGGEALYNSHESDPETGIVLSAIGTPCLIEAEVPISILNQHSFLAMKVVRNFLKNRDYDMKECIDHEGYATNNLDSCFIKRVMKYPDSDFIRLTGCDEWDDPNLL
ncbi:hypothetical protein BFP97_06445 [Roseivirga sp. 4D4]|uniref:hypothetical protein n=1 Tax=Roseivirga sp. 4D4 TaxID=1889784 RepID=UPI00085290A5|nr:hypothetical protein [Roseivirga sp. 4D4]OEK01171.1 hypothetical protein BFP97_06445 [Roseivirga sp. 4D4]